MMRNKSFCVFILSHGRPEVKTLRTLKKHGWRGKTYIVCDTDDKTLDEYKRAYGDSVLVFDKADVDCDLGCNFKDVAGAVQARNYCFDLAEKLGYQYFCELDDDYEHFEFRRTDNDGKLLSIRVARLGRVFDSLIDFLKTDRRIKAVSLGQGGDFIGGAENTQVAQERFYRKTMNSWICKTAERVPFAGLFNDDVTAYVTDSQRGFIYTQTSLCNLVAEQTQKTDGGVSEAYRKYGTYVKSFFTVMRAPSCVKISTMGMTSVRIHHKISPLLAYPKVVSGRFSKLRGHTPFLKSEKGEGGQGTTDP